MDEKKTPTIEFKQLLSDTLKNLDRWDVAVAMSRLLDAEISKYMVDSWVAPSKKGHRLPAEYLPAFCDVCQSLAPLDYLARRAGAYLAPSEKELLARIEILQSQQQKCCAEIEIARALLREIGR